MALNMLKCNHLASLGVKGLIVWHDVTSDIIYIIPKVIIVLPSISTY